MIFNVYLRAIVDETPTQSFLFKRGRVSFKTIGRFYLRVCFCVGREEQVGRTTRRLSFISSVIVWESILARFRRRIVLFTTFIVRSVLARISKELKTTSLELVSFVS